MAGCGDRRSGARGARGGRGPLVAGARTPGRPIRLGPTDAVPRLGDAPGVVARWPDGDIRARGVQPCCPVCARPDLRQGASRRRAGTTHQRRHAQDEPRSFPRTARASPMRASTSASNGTPGRCPSLVAASRSRGCGTHPDWRGSTRDASCSPRCGSRPIWASWPPRKAASDSTTSICRATYRAWRTCLPVTRRQMGAARGDGWSSRMDAVSRGAD